MAVKIIAHHLFLCFLLIYLLPPYCAPIIQSFYLWLCFWVAMLRDKKWTREEIADYRGQRVIKYTLVKLSRRELLQSAKKAEWHVHSGLICCPIWLAALYFLYPK